MNGLTIRAEANAPEATLYMYGDVEKWGKASVDNVLRTLADLKADTTLHVRIHSYGGEVYEGNAIINALKNHKGTVHTYVDGIAASMASVIFQAGSTRTMAENAMLMVHNPWTYTWGSAPELRKTAELLDKLTESLLATYSKRSGKPVDELRKLLDEETWMTAQEAVDMKLADDISESVMNGDPKDALARKDAPRAMLMAAYKPVDNPDEPKNERSKEPKTNIDMDLKVLAASLGLPETAKEAEVLAAANQMKAERDKLEAEAKAASEAAARARITTLVEAAIADKKIVPAAKAQWEKMAETDYDNTKAILDTMPKVQSLAGQVTPEAGKLPEKEAAERMAALKAEYPASASDLMKQIKNKNKR